MVTGGSKSLGKKWGVESSEAEARLVARALCRRPQENKTYFADPALPPDLAGVGVDAGSRKLKTDQPFCLFTVALGSRCEEDPTARGL